MRQSPNEELDASQVEPSLGTGDRSLKVFGQAAVAIEPSERSFDHPAAGKHDEAGSVSFDDLDRPAAELGESLRQFVAGIGTIGEEVAQPGEEIVNGFDDERGAIAVLNIGGVNLGADEEANRIGDDMALASFDFFASIYPGGPPLSVVLTDWLSMIPAEGLASRPAASRVSTNNSKLIRPKMPLSRQA